MAHIYHPYASKIVASALAEAANPHCPGSGLFFPGEK
jgi:hypothetical protein